MFKPENTLFQKTFLYDHISYEAQVFSIVDSTSSENKQHLLLN